MLMQGECHATGKINTYPRKKQALKCLFMIPIIYKQILKMLHQPQSF